MNNLPLTKSENNQYARKLAQTPVLVEKKKSIIRGPLQQGPSLWLMVPHWPFALSSF